MDRDNSRVELAQKVRALQSPASYPGNATAVEAVETHFAWVFLVDGHAYKLKKPAGNPAADLHSVETRRASCAEELRLNRALAADVYLDVVPLVRDANGQLRVGGGGTVVDWLVRMRRLPAESMLDRAIATGAATPAALAAVGVMLAKFYREQPQVEFTPERYVTRIAEQIHADRRALFAPELALDNCRVQDAVTAIWRALSTVETELEQRARDGRIVEAHGDLRPEHICCADPPCVIDSLEFSRDLRTLDPAEELSFLWIECEQAGGAWAAERVLTAYRRESGDPVSNRLLDFYRARRAMVRAKILAWHLLDPAVMSLAPWRERAATYLSLAEHYASVVIAPARSGAAEQSFRRSAEMAANGGASAIESLT